MVVLCYSLLIWNVTVVRWVFIVLLLLLIVVCCCFVYIYVVVVVVVLVHVVIVNQLLCLVYGEFIVVVPDVALFDLFGDCCCCCW